MLKVSNNFLKLIGLASVIFASSLVGVAEMSAEMSREAMVVQISEETCGKQIGSPQENSPFEVYVFCEGALGRYIGIMRKGQMGAPNIGGWTFTNRFWQDDTWSTDVMSIAWVNDGKSLLVSTSEIYGEGGIYILNLESRSSRILFSNALKNSRRFTINRVDESKREVFLNVEEEEKIRSQSVVY